MTLLLIWKTSTFLEPPFKGSFRGYWWFPFPLYNSKTEWYPPWVMRFFLQTIHEWCGFFCNTPMMSSEWCGFFCQPPMRVMRFFLPTTHEWCGFFCNPPMSDVVFSAPPPWCLLSDAVFSATPPWSFLSDVFFLPTPFECCGFFCQPWRGDVVLICYVEISKLFQIAFCIFLSKPCKS